MTFGDLFIRFGEILMAARSLKEKIKADLPGGVKELWAKRGDLVSNHIGQLEIAELFEVLDKDGLRSCGANDYG